MNKLLETDLERHGEYGKLYKDIMIRIFIWEPIKKIPIKILKDLMTYLWEGKGEGQTLPFGLGLEYGRFFASLTSFN